MIVRYYTILEIHFNLPDGLDLPDEVPIFDGDNDIEVQVGKARDLEYEDEDSVLANVTIREEYKNYSLELYYDEDGFSVWAFSEGW